MFGSRILTAFGLVAGAVLLTAAGPISMEEFRDRLAAEIGKATGKSTTVSGQGQFRTESGTFNVDGAYDLYLRDPARIDEVIARYVRLMAKPEEPGKADLAQLVVVVRPADYVSSLNAPPGQAVALPPRKMGGDMAYFLAVDSPETIRLAAFEDLKRWKIDEASAWQRAYANLPGRIGNIVRLQNGSPDGASGLATESGLGPSLLALSCGPHSQMPKLGASMVVLVVDREAYLYGMKGDPDSMRRFWRDVREIIAGPGATSRTPLECRDGSWQPAPMP